MLGVDIDCFTFPLTVHVLEFPDESVPKAPAFSNLRKNPCVPYEEIVGDKLAFHSPVVLSVEPKVEGVKAVPSTK